jgi:hypothetical protein
VALDAEGGAGFVGIEVSPGAACLSSAGRPQSVPRADVEDEFASADEVRRSSSRLQQRAPSAVTCIAERTTEPVEAQPRRAGAARLTTDFRAQRPDA